ncbi:MAG: RNA methyltransferase [Breznakibacter sp.]
MLSKNKLKLIASLQNGKFRKEHKLFVAEGTKLVTDLNAAGATIECLVATAEWLTEFNVNCRETIECSGEEMRKASFLKTPASVLALVRIPDSGAQIKPTADKLILVLDDVQDPGNMGTIIRLADWFGIDALVCSIGTVDCYNPKVIQATMGAIARVNVQYTQLGGYLGDAAKAGIPVYGTFLEGNPIYTETLPANGIIVLGNEGKGIGPEVASLVNKKLLIPDFSQGSTKPESLNVSVAAAIVCSEFRRRGFFRQA